MIKRNSTAEQSFATSFHVDLSILIPLIDYIMRFSVTRKRNEWIFECRMFFSFFRWFWYSYKLFSTWWRPSKRNHKSINHRRYFYFMFSSTFHWFQSKFKPPIIQPAEQLIIKIIFQRNKTLDKQHFVFTNSLIKSINYLQWIISYTYSKNISSVWFQLVKRTMFRIKICE